MKANKLNKKVKIHLKKDMKEYKEGMEEDKMLMKSLKKLPNKRGKK